MPVVARKADMQDMMNTPRVAGSSARDESLVLRSETVRSVETSEQQAMSAGAVDVRPFHTEVRNAHPPPPPKR